MTGTKHPSGCSTTVIRLTFGEQSDPLVYGRIMLLKEWVHLLDKHFVETKALDIA